MNKGHLTFYAILSRRIVNEDNHLIIFLSFNLQSKINNKQYSDF